MENSSLKKYGAEALGTFVLTLFGCGSAAIAGATLGTLGIAFAFGLSMAGAVIVEIILTCIFVLAVLGSTADEKTAPFAGIIIGLTLTFVHIMGIPLTGTSVNPARSFGPALAMLTQGDAAAMGQVWVFIVAPLVGAAIAAGIFAAFKSKAAKNE